MLADLLPDLFIAAAYVLLLARFSKGGRRLFAAASLPLLIFCLGYILACLAGHPAMLRHELRNFLSLVLLCLGIPGLLRDARYEKLQRSIRVLLRILMLWGSLFSLFALIFFAFNLHGKIRIAGMWLLIGLLENRMWVFGNPNFVALLCYTAIWATVALWIYERQNGPVRSIYHVVYSVVLLLNAGAFILAQSRATILAGLLTVALAIGLLIPHDRRFKRIPRLLLRTVASLVSVVLLSAFFYVMSAALHRLPSFMMGQLIPALTQEADDLSVHISNEEPLPEEHVGQAEDPGLIGMFSDKKLEGHSWEARLILWDYGLRYFRSSPLVGLGKETVRQRAIRDFPPQFRLQSYLVGDFHNTYISILAYGGLLGFLAMGSFMIFFLRAMFLYFLNVPRRYFEKILLLFIPAMLLREALESCCLYTLFNFSLLFWLMIGYGLYCFTHEGIIRDRLALTTFGTRLLERIKKGLAALHLKTKKSALPVTSRVEEIDQ